MQHNSRYYQWHWHDSIQFQFNFVVPIFYRLTQLNSLLLKLLLEMLARKDCQSHTFIKQIGAFFFQKNFLVRLGNTLLQATSWPCSWCCVEIVENYYAFYCSQRLTVLRTRNSFIQWIIIHHVWTVYMSEVV